MKKFHSKKPDQEVVLKRLLYLFARYTLKIAYPNTKSITTVPALHTSNFTLPTSSLLTHTSHVTYIGAADQARLTKRSNRLHLGCKRPHSSPHNYTASPRKWHHDHLLSIPQRKRALLIPQASHLLSSRYILIILSVNI